MPWWAAAWLGYMSGLRSGDRRRNGIRVICYHGVTPCKKDLRLERNLQLLSDFQAQVNLLRRFRVLSLDELTDKPSTLTKQTKPTAVITFNDGYANNLLAAEVLERAHLPWSVFITTGAVDRDRTIWTVALSLLLLHGQAKKVEALNRVWPLRTRAERETAFQEIRYPLKSMSCESRRREMSAMEEQFPSCETQRLLSRFPSLRLLSWEEIRQLSSSGVGIGSHGVAHEIHHEEQPEFVRLFELRESKSELERQVGRSCDVFAFPDGSFSANSPNEILAAGYKLALTTQRGTFKPEVHQQMVPRLTPISSLREFSRELLWESQSAPDEI